MKTTLGEWIKPMLRSFDIPHVRSRFSDAKTKTSQFLRAIQFGTLLRASLTLLFSLSLFVFPLMSTRVANARRARGTYIYMYIYIDAGRDNSSGSAFCVAKPKAARGGTRACGPPRYGPRDTISRWLKTRVQHVCGQLAAAPCTPINGVNCRR